MRALIPTDFKVSITLAAVSSGAATNSINFDYRHCYYLLHQQQHQLRRRLDLQHQPPAQAQLKCHLLQHGVCVKIGPLQCTGTHLVHTWVVCCSHVDSFTSAKYYVLSFVLNNMVLVMQGPPPRARLDLYIKGNNELKASTIL